MASDGLVMMNVFDPSAKAELLRSITATMALQFRSVMDLRISRGNHMLLGFASTSDPNEQSLTSPVLKRSSL